MENHQPLKPDWRKGYHEQIAAHVDQLRIFRKDHSDRVYEVRGRNRRAYDLSEDDILYLARELAEKDIQWAINEWNCREVENRRRLRNGQGY